ncbi:hypothetical protein [Natranaerovirga pectinivora]|nr:hypothetical protein [Natranaerovirga pectinivora]
MIQSYEDCKLKGEIFYQRIKLWKVLLSFLKVGLCFFILHSFFNLVNIPKNHIVIEDVKLPVSISLYKNIRESKLEQDKINSILNNEIQIQSSDIEKITKELITSLKIKRLQNLTGIGYLNYLRLISDVQYYRMSFSTPSLNENHILENGYIDQLFITLDRQVYIIEYRSRKGLFSNNYYVYPITLSDEVLDLIFSYIDESI